MQLYIKTYEELTKNELYALLRLRAQVFVVEQNCPYVDLDNLDQAAIHLWITKENNPVAYTRIIRPGAYYKEASIGRVLTTPTVRNTGLGKEIFKKSIAEAKRLFQEDNIRIMAQSYLIRFYQGFEFQVVSEEFLEDGIPHVEMLLNT